VPQCNPSSTVVAGGYSSDGYWPATYPGYYYTYPPGAVASGMIWRAAITAVLKRPLCDALRTSGR